MTNIVFWFTLMAVLSNLSIIKKKIQRRYIFNLLIYYLASRNTTIGNTLQESLDELIQYGQITPALAVKVLLQFDKSINQALSNKVKSRLTFKAGKLNTYRFCDNVWTFMLNHVEFREAVTEISIVDKVKIVACDGKNIEDRR